MLRQVLVPLDGSPLAESALNYAGQITDKTSMVQLLVVLANVDNFFVPTPNSVKKMDEQLASARQYLQGVAKRLHSDFGANTAIEVKVGDPAQTIVEAAERKQVDAIIMSTHGRSGVDRVIFGSVAQKVLQLTPCPVFVIPGRETDKAAKPASQLRPATN